MANAYKNKIVYGNTTLIDLTEDTVTASTLLQGYTAHDATGAPITGTATAGGGSAITVTDTLDAAGGTIRTITAVDISNDTVTAATLLQGYTAHDAQGNAITGTASSGSSGTDTSDATLTSGNQMLSGITAYSNGTKYTGTIETKTASDLTASGASVTVPAGYYAEQASKSIASGSAATPATTITANPTISVNSSGLITATASASQNVTPTVSAGYVSSGTAGTITVSGSATEQLTTQAAQTINTSTTDQTITSGTYLTGTQTIKAVTTSNLTAANIAAGVTVKVGDANDDDRIASVTGTFTSDATAGAGDIVSGETAYANGSQVTGTLVIQHYYTGSSDPSSSLGSDGDIYLKVVS